MDETHATSTAQLAQFVDAFRRGVGDEIKAMRDRFGALELALGDGAEVDDGTYEFTIAGSFGRLASGDECSLKARSGEWLVTVEAIDASRVRLRARESLDLTAAPFALVSGPWFLHSRLIEALEALDPTTHAVDRGLALFGKREARRVPRDLLLPHDRLNPSQRDAVALTVESDLSFVWGPPGTGKTTTLAHIVLELVAGGERVLLTSTTNAALDQALAKLVGDGAIADADAGAMVRLGTSEAQTYGCQLDELTARLQGALARTLARLQSRSLVVGQIVEAGARLADKVAAAVHPQQSLFPEAQTSVGDWELEGLVPRAMVNTARTMAPSALALLVDRRLRRFKRLARLLGERRREVRGALRQGARAIVENASVVLATLAHVYLSPILIDDAFDVVVIEEASMATLPTLFFAACLGHKRTVVVGDPRQLPPIVTADSRLAERVLGRNIFTVTVPDPHASSLVAMLDTQYRMVPAIGDLVGELFYDGRLHHGPTSAAPIAAAAPFPGSPLVVVDTSGATRCERGDGGRSRVNAASAGISVELAAEASGEGRTVAIITPYAAQARAIRAALEAQRIAGVECSTIHRFQGQERDVVIIDLVDTGDMPASILLGERSRSSDAACLLNVSISRAAGKLILVADVGFFDTRLRGSIASEVIAAAARRGVVRRVAGGWVDTH